MTRQGIYNLLVNGEWVTIECKLAKNDLPATQEFLNAIRLLCREQERADGGADHGWIADVWQGLAHS